MRLGGAAGGVIVELVRISSRLMSNIKNFNSAKNMSLTVESANNLFVGARPSLSNHHPYSVEEDTSQSN